MQFLFESAENQHRANIWTHDRKMENSMPTTADESKKIWESIYALQGYITSASMRAKFLSTISKRVY